MVKDGQANPRFLTATSFAVEAHGRIRQERKGTTYPYVVHPIRVGEILWRPGEEHRRGRDPARRTRGHPRHRGAAAEALRRGSPRSWASRSRTSHFRGPSGSKRQSIACGPRRIPLVWMVAAADKLDNVRTIRDTIAERGEARPGNSSTRRGPIRRPTTARWRKRWLRTIRSRHSSSSSRSRSHELFAPAGDTDWPFLHATELRLPEQARPYLAEPRRQWLPGASAYELAHAWIRDVPGVPPRVAQVLARRRSRSDGSCTGSSNARSRSARPAGAARPT